MTLGRIFKNKVKQFGNAVMSKTINPVHWLLLDVNYLAYRALYSTGRLAHQQNPTGVFFGVLSEALRLMERFGTNNICFCFDYGKPKRLELLPTYKSTRKKARKLETALETQARMEMQEQLRKMKEDLPRLGFRNVFFVDGFEADDLIASLALSIPQPHFSTIISSDEDLYQLLGTHVRYFNPHKKSLMNGKVFTEEYGITPAQWATVKALAGCSGDDVPGIPGVGEKTAIKFLRNELKPGTKTAAKFDNAAQMIETNTPLVKLPFEGTPKLIRKRDKLTKDKWRNVLSEYGFTTLIDQYPGPKLR